MSVGLSTTGARSTLLTVIENGSVTGWMPSVAVTDAL